MKTSATASILRKKVPPKPLLAWNAVTVLLFAGGYAYPYLQRYLQMECPFHRITGVPCCACGTTRAIVSFVHLDIAAAFFYNPLVLAFCAVSAVAIIYCAVIWISGIRAIQFRLPRPLPVFWRFVLLFVLLLNWALVIGFHGTHGTH